MPISLSLSSSFILSFPQLLFQPVLSLIYRKLPWWYWPMAVKQNFSGYFPIKFFARKSTIHLFFLLLARGNSSLQEMPHSIDPNEQWFELDTYSVGSVSSDFCDSRFHSTTIWRHVYFCHHEESICPERLSQNQHVARIAYWNRQCPKYNAEDSEVFFFSYFCVVCM